MPDESPKQEEKYDRDELIASSRAFADVSPPVMAGALANESRKTFTVEQTKKLVSDYLKRPVEVDNEGDDE